MQTKAQKLVRDLLHYDREELVTLNLFWIGFVVYTVSWTISKSTQVNYIICQLLQLAGLFVFIPACIRLIKFRFNNEYQKIVFFLFLFWAIIIFLRGLEEIDTDLVKLIVFDAWFGGFLYFAPIVMLFPLKLIYYKKIFDVLIILAVFYVIFDIMFIHNLMEPDVENVLSRDVVEYFSKTLSVPIAFILLTYVYHSKPKIFFAICILILTAFFGVVRARRGLLFMIAASFLLAYLIFWYNSKNRTLILIISSFFLAVMGVVGLYLLHTGSINLFENIEDRGMEDTRSGVEKYFKRDMEGIDWIIGRGMMGEYYSPTGDQNLFRDSYRGTVETDYLNMVLKGGYINLILLLMILIPAMFLGIFKSKNTLSKAAGVWILFWLLNTYPSTVQVFTLNYLLVWVSAGICYSSKIRSLPEKFLIAYFRPNKILKPGSS